MSLLKPTYNLHSNLGIQVTAHRKPSINEGATICYAKDRHAGTVVAYDHIRKIVTVQQDKATRIDNNGMSDSQDYRYETDENGALYHFKFKNGKWVEVMKSDKGRWKQMRSSNGIIIGERDEFYDFTF
jgi:hypothetical protein